MVFNELKIYFKKYKIIIIMLYLLITMLLLLLGSFLYFMDSLKYEEKGLKETYDNKALYRLIDQYRNEDEIEFMAKKDALEILKNYYTSLNTNDKFQYLHVNSQPIELKETSLHNKFKEGYEYGQINENINGFSYVKSLQINKRASDFFNIEVSEGRVFDNNDFEVNEEYLPIILGDAYKEYYKVGDVLEIKYYLKDFNAKVIGFAKPSSKILLNGKLEEYLSNYIIIPQVNFLEPKNKEEYEFQRISYIVRASGYVVVNDNLNEIQNMMNEIRIISEKTGFEKYVFLGANPHLNQYGELMSVIKENQELVKGILICTIVLNTIILGIIIFLQTKTRVSYYAIHYIQGANMKQILIQQLLESITVFLASFITYVILMNNIFKLGDVKIHIILLVFIILLCIILISFSAFHIRNNSLSKFLSYNDTEGR